MNLAYEPSTVPRWSPLRKEKTGWKSSRMNRTGPDSQVSRIMMQGISPAGVRRGFWRLSLENVGRSSDQVGGSLSLFFPSSLLPLHTAYACKISSVAD